LHAYLPFRQRKKPVEDIMMGQGILPKETNVLVLQGGGALGAYQAGAAVALASAGKAPDWVAGISIGAINAAIIAGNPPERREERLHAFWDRCSSGATLAPMFGGPTARQMSSEWSANLAMMRGVSGFFRPRLPPAAFRARGSDGAISHYDTAPLRDTLGELVDFEWLNSKGPRVSLGAVEVKTGNFAYFDSRAMKITADHVMASGALPPAFAPVRIHDKAYWDGGLVSNTPLQFVLENAGAEPLCIFQVDLFSARGAMPADMADVMQREKDIRFSSRTRLNTDLFRERHDLSAAALRLRDRLPKEFRNDPDLAALCHAGPQGPVTLMHLIHRKEAFEGAAKDYEFSRPTMTQHWEAGARDVARSLAHREWKARPDQNVGIAIYDFGRAECVESTAGGDMK
jgi:NTE family protein